MYKLFKKLFPKYFSDLEEKCKSECESMLKECKLECESKLRSCELECESLLRNAKYQLMQAEEKNSLINDVFTKLHLPGISIIDIREKGENEQVFILLHDETLYLYSQYYRNAPVNLPKIYFKVDNDDRTLHIIDVLMVDYNQGYGTIAMEALIDYAKRIKMSYITGWFSPVDDDHSDRRRHYYEKFGFEINGRSIKLALDSLSEKQDS